MKSCPGDSFAEAYVLSDVGTSRFVDDNGSFKIYFNRTTRIKILKVSGTKWANVSIPLYHKGQIYEEINKLSGKTINFEDGKIQVSNLDPKDCFQEREDENYNLKKFALPAVKEGSIIEFSYEFSTPYLFNMPGWNFQWEIPVKYSEYRVSMIPFYEYTFIMKGASHFDYKEEKESDGFPREFSKISFRDMNYIFVMKDLPAFRDEAFITSENDYRISFDFQLSKITYPDGRTVKYMTSWPEMIKDLNSNEYFGKFIKACRPAARDALKEIGIDSIPEEDKVRIIVDYVKKSYKWSGQHSKFSDQNVREFLKRKFGNSAEINFFLLAMLQEAEITCYPVLLSTRDHGKVYHEFPFQHFFNNIVVLTEVKGSLILTDGSLASVPYNKIPPDCINDQGLIIKKNCEEWVELAEKTPSIIDTKIIQQFNPDKRMMESSFIIRSMGYDACHLRSIFSDSEEHIKDHYIEKGYEDIDSVSLVDLLDGTRNEFTLKFKTLNQLTSGGNTFYISPLLNEPLAENPLRQSDRNFPIDFTYPITRNYSSVTIIPEGYKIDGLPNPIDYDTKTYRVRYQALFKNNQLLVYASYTFKKAIYDPSEYKSLRIIFSEITRTFNKKIVLLKT